MEEIIRLDNLSFCYPDGQAALNDISITIHQGESVAIIGANGAGKSTLLLHLNGILRSNGRVKVLGRTVEDKNLRWIRSRVGLVFQNPDDQLFSPTVFDDVAFAPINMGYCEDEVRQCVTTALERVGMAGYQSRSPHHLSVGEKKRVAIATVLSMSLQILVIDEPTSNLDPASKWSLIELLKGLPITKVIATHDLELAQALCRRVIVLDGGYIVADDAADRILDNKRLLAAHGLAPAEVA
ncbi:MAG: ABC transporter ATP-binding protein [Dehalococcoidia bacterium]|nr:MAG: ABC transporter ATP-binding protein [Dehalococcoidia bacterium]